MVDDIARRIRQQNIEKIKHIQAQLNEQDSAINCKLQNAEKASTQNKNKHSTYQPNRNQISSHTPKENHAYESNLSSRILQQNQDVYQLNQTQEEDVSRRILQQDIVPGDDFDISRRILQQNQDVYQRNQTQEEEVSRRILQQAITSSDDSDISRRIMQQNQDVHLLYHTKDDELSKGISQADQVGDDVSLYGQEPSPAEEDGVSRRILHRDEDFHYAVRSPLQDKDIPGRFTEQSSESSVLAPPSEATQYSDVGASGRRRPSASQVTRKQMLKPDPVPYNHSMLTPEIEDSLHERGLHGIRERMLAVGLKPRDHASDYRKQLKLMAQANREEVDAQKAEIAKKKMMEQRLRHSAMASHRQPHRELPMRANTNPRKAETKKSIVEGPPRKTRAGEVPLYLQRRKAEWEANARAEAEAAAAAAECPEGLRIVGTEEKRRILDLLADERGKTDDALRRLPFVIKTQSTQSKKTALENRLDEIDEAIAAYSKERVLVPDDGKRVS